MDLLMEWSTTIKAILFDLDGTLVEAKEWHYNALNSALTKVSNTKISRYEHVSELDGFPTKKKLQWLLERDRIDRSDVDKIEKLKQVETLRMVQRFCVPDKAKIELCKCLSEHYRLACVSNAVMASIETMLLKSNLLPFFEFIQSNENVRPKPHPDPYLKTMKHMRVAPSECVAVEDNSKGVQSAEAAGIRCLHLQYPEITLERVRRYLDEINA